MKSEETTYQNEETEVITNETPVTEEATEEVETKSSNGAWKRVVIGGVAGMVLGGATVYTANAVTGKETSDDIFDFNDEEIPVSDDSHITVDSSIQVATVSDDISFGEAFASAREQVGAGGVFEWNGNVYATHYAEEWDQMSSEEREEFGSHINYSRGSVADSVEEDVVADSDPVIQAEVEEEIAVEADTEAEDEIEIVAVEEDSDVQILEISEETLDDDSVIAEVHTDSEDLLYINATDSEMGDICNVDTIGDEEYIDIQDSNLSIDEIDPNMGLEQDQYLASNDLPDYIGEDCNLA